LSFFKLPNLVKIAKDALNVMRDPQRRVLHSSPFGNQQSVSNVFRSSSSSSSPAVVVPQSKNEFRMISVRLGMRLDSTPHRVCVLEVRLIVSKDTNEK